MGSTRYTAWLALGVVAAALSCAAGCTRWRQATVIEPDFVAPQLAEPSTGDTMASSDDAHRRLFFDPIAPGDPGVLADADGPR